MQYSISTGGSQQSQKTQVPMNVLSKEMYWINVSNVNFMLYPDQSHISNKSDHTFEMNVYFQM
jgi:hypothetical protein